ncbi:MAG TPA: thiamine pyrophosphate-dependent enzyme, partial [Chloroflexota bacterium]|nr:thiamine pyrophosphate-dependent enzyme [Chloroflexota bacterium]
GKNALYEYDQVAMLKPLTKWIGLISQPEYAPEMMRKAFRVATSGRPGPVVLIQRLVSDKQVPDAHIFCEPQYIHFPATRVQPDPAQIKEAVRLLSQAERPCIVAGGGVNTSRAWDELRTFVQASHIPVATTISGKGAFSEHDPLSAGAIGDIQGGRLGRGRVAAQVVKESDVVLLIGTRTNQMCTNSWSVPDRNSTIIHIDIDPMEIGRNYDTALGIVADAKLALAALTEELGSASFKPPKSRALEIHDLLEQWEADNRDVEYSNQQPMHPGRLIKEVRPFIDDNTILVSDGSSPFMWGSSHIKVHAGPTFISPRGTGAIGTGLPMALGAKLAAPGKKVVCLEGDGGLMCGILAELEVGARYNLAMPVIVFNNGSLLHEKNRMKGDLREEMDFVPGLDFAKVGEGLKCEAVRIERPEQIAPAMEQAFAAKGLTVLDVVLDHYLGFPAEDAGSTWSPRAQAAKQA